MSATTSGPVIAEGAPAMIREKMSRPSWSVPSQCSDDGEALVLRRSCSLGSWGMIQRQKSAMKMTTPTMAQDVTRKNDGIRWKPLRRRMERRGVAVAIADI